MIIRPFVALASLAMLCSNAANAGSLRYLSPADADYTSISAPPVTGSKEEADDLTQVLALQATRTPAECARAQNERFLEFSASFGAPLGPLSSAQIQAGTMLYNQVKSDTDSFVVSIKHHWMRPRPYLESHDVQPCLSQENSSSFPSGHATISRVEALAFGLIYPEKARALLTRANEIGLDRVIGGVHHPLDIQAGQSLGDLLFSKMQLNANFNSEIKSERASHPNN